MFAGHAAFALLAKAKRPRVPLALLVSVAFAPDCIEWVFAVLGNHNREFSHSLVSIGICATLVALTYGVVRRDWSEAIAVWLTYVSHWPADFVTGRKPTWPGGPTVGLLLYGKPLADGAIELALIAVCWLAYRQSLPRESRQRPIVWLVPVGLAVAEVAFLLTG